GRRTGRVATTSPALTTPHGRSLIAWDDKPGTVQYVDNDEVEVDDNEQASLFDLDTADDETEAADDGPPPAALRHIVDLAEDLARGHLEAEGTGRCAICGRADNGPWGKRATYPCSTVTTARQIAWIARQAQP